MKKDLTVIIPLYNQEKYVRKCVESVANQNNIDLSIIIVNDGSTDKSLQICNEIAFNDKRIRIISQENQGLAGARQTGIKAANTKYITFVDADDFITPNAYADSFIYMEKDVDQIFYEISRYYNDGAIKHEPHVIEAGLYNREQIEKDIYPILIWNFKRNTPGIECSQCVRIVKRELLIEAYENLQGKNFYYGEDIAITYPLTKMIKKLVVIPRSYYMHRQREGIGVPQYIVSEGYFDEIANLYGFLRTTMNKNEKFDFNKQIDYMYIYSMELKKWCYGDCEYYGDFLFPFHKIPVGKKIILYGAGLVGNIYYKQLSKLSYCKKLLWVDRNAERLNNPLVKSVSKLDGADPRSYDNIVIALENIIVAKSVRDFLISKGYDSEKIVI